MSELILYSTEDGRSQIKLRTKSKTVWLSQREMAELFDVSTDNIGLHLKNIFEDGELTREATTEDSSVVQTEGARQVRRTVSLYNLDAILAVGYRVRSPRGVQFRRWASTVLKEFISAIGWHQKGNRKGEGQAQRFPEGIGAALTALMQPSPTALVSGLPFNQICSNVTTFRLAQEAPYDHHDPIQSRVESGRGASKEGKQERPGVHHGSR